MQNEIACLTNKIELFTQLFFTEDTTTFEKVIFDVNSLIQIYERMLAAEKLEKKLINF